MRQTDLFPRATRIVSHLETYAAEIAKEIDRLEEAADDRRAKAKALLAHHQEILKSIGDAQAFAAALAPTMTPGDEIVEVVKEKGPFDVGE